MSTELTAISEALKYIKNLPYSYIVILTDSKSALQHLAGCVSGRRGTPTAYAILKQILQLNQDNKNLRLQWVPSHIGLSGNEEADKMAKLGVTLGQPLKADPSYVEYIHLIKMQCQKDWKTYFDERSTLTGIWYRSMQAEPPRIPWFKNLRLSRKLIVIAHRLRSGHIPLNRFGFLMKKVPSPNCEVCGKIEDVLHLLAECVKNQAQRDSLVATLKVNKLDVGVFQSILSNPTSDKALLTYRFAAESLKASP